MLSRYERIWQFSVLRHAQKYCLDWQLYLRHVLINAV